MIDLMFVSTMGWNNGSLIRLNVRGNVVVAMLTIQETTTSAEKYYCIHSL